MLLVHKTMFISLQRVLVTFAWASPWPLGTMPLKW